ncbi:MAG: Aspartate carbamoyltransferase [Candidatus Roizmanbacteria bacterium GW2011_GWB1_40_7]|uniref:Aspartate carbamoyltransferase n=2 Tax=Candidatus Roizmaniibacteriota TaxID=1752723 RepID=A0A0G0X8B9_9BACT|nr:MAG: Aspartate carbamoyltransferase [Candidatus Roizmanbacteria bacterium GW2011_GWB1_40_7]KKS20632.1 MAG: Aspartate carbamoyltransferase [Candidatus Roizmanbacteria bacterium GW2011_GWC2_41_7]
MERISKPQQIKMKKINGNFYQKSIVSIDQFDAHDIEKVFDVADSYKKGLEKGTVFHDLEGKLLTALFYEPSSRTFGSFTAATQRLGGGIIPIQGVQFSSVVKGETLEDTIRVFASYSDAIALRHPEEGASKHAAEVSPVPIINAGDGVGEHPTQALLDLYTIKERLGRTEHLSIAMVGDLKYGRTVHSLSKLLSLYKNIVMYFVCPKTSQMPQDIVNLIKKRGVKIEIVSSIQPIIDKIDVLYMTRVQKERMDKKLYESIKDLFILNGRMAGRMKKKSIIMHPLPRIHEMTTDVDSNPRAVYFTHEVKNGMYVRMALLKLVLTK